MADWRCRGGSGAMEGGARAKATRAHTHTRSGMVFPLTCEIRYHVMGPWLGSVRTMNGIPLWEFRCR